MRLTEQFIRRPVMTVLLNLAIVSGLAPGRSAVTCTTGVL